MNDDDLDRELRALGGVDIAGSHPTLADVRARARAVHRRQARTRAVTGGALALVLAVTGVVTPGISGLLGHGGRAADAEPTCHTSFDPEDPHSDIELYARDLSGHESALESLRLPPQRRPSNVTLRQDVGCQQAPPSAVLYDARAAQGMTVWSGTFGAWSPTDPGMHVKTVGGQRFYVTSVPIGNRLVTWTDAGGTKHHARADGIPLRELLTDLGALRFDGDGVQRSSVPAGFASYPVPAAPTDDARIYSWGVEYGEADGDSVSADFVDLDITTMPQAPVQGNASYHGGVKFASVDGHAAVWLPKAEGGAHLTWQAGDATYSLALPWGTTRAKAIRFAEALTPVTVNDPRLGAVEDALGKG